MASLETRQFLKCLSEHDRDKTPGFSALGVGADEIMSCVQITMIRGMSYTTLREAILARPAPPKGLISLFSSTPPS
jgi:pyruvate/2-oxoglutarate dehydrogenase complex dihydrolipoamide dehydrogenase (E3) component